MQDPTLLEIAWVELLEKNKSVIAEELAEVVYYCLFDSLSCCSVYKLRTFCQMIFGSSDPLDSYSAHLLLSRDEIYFTVLETKGSRSVYGPRPTVQVLFVAFEISFSFFEF